MAWGDEQWSIWGASRGWYKGAEAVDGTASYLCQDVQLRHPAGAIVVGTVILMEPLNAGADDEVWRLEISLPGYSERWEYRRGWACITRTYIQGDDAGFAGHIKPSVPIDTVEAFAVYATEYLHALDPRVEYPAYRDIMRPQIMGRRAVSSPRSWLRYNRRSTGASSPSSRQGFNLPEEAEA